MTVTMEDVRAHLEADELDYPAAATALGRDALPHLRELVQGPDGMLASKAIYLASVIGGAEAAAILDSGSRQPDPIRRVAAASGLRNLGQEAAAPVADQLLTDDDMGVRKVTLKAVASFGSPAMKRRVREAAEHDPEPALRDLAARALAS